MTTLNFDCYTVEKSVKQGGKCTICDWTAEEPEEENASNVISQVILHVRETGHSVDRTYKSTTSYAGEKRTEAIKIRPPAPKRTVMCKTCKKMLAEKATGIVVFWAARSHHKATGHEVVVFNADSSIAAHYP